MMAENVRLRRAGRGGLPDCERASCGRRATSTGPPTEPCRHPAGGRFSFLQKYIKKNTQWVFDLSQKENARWMLFFLKDVSHAPVFESLELDVQE